MKISAYKIIMTLFGVFIIAFLAIKCFDYFYDPFITETAYKVTVNETVDASAIAVRNERIVRSSERGVAVYAVENGSKVGRGAELIEYFGSSADAVKKQQIDTLSNHIDTLNDIFVQNSNYAADLDLVSANITDNLFSMLCSVDDEDLPAVSKHSDELLYSLCRSGVTTGEIKGLDKKIAELRTRLNKLKNDYNEPTGRLNSDDSGYFVNYVDGFEGAVDFSRVNELTPEQFDKIKATGVASDAVGKIICDSSWYIITKVPKNSVRSLYEGDNVKVLIPAASSESISASVVKMTDDEQGKNVLIVLGCTNMNARLCQIRRQDIKIVVDSHTGLKVSSKAVRIIDGQRGVYIRLGGGVKFRPIDVVYSTGDYVIAATSNKDGEIKIYDDVIVKGKVIDNG